MRDVDQQRHLSGLFELCFFPCPVLGRLLNVVSLTSNMTQYVNKFVVFIYVTLTQLVVAWQTGSVAGESPTGSRVSRP